MQRESLPSCQFTPVGIVSSGRGPLFLAGANLEHSTEAEVLLVPGSVNHVILGLQTEEAPVALSLNSSLNAVVFGTLGAFWNSSERIPSAVFATRPRPAPLGHADLSYRLSGVVVPIADSDSFLVVDSASGPIPAGAGFEYATAIYNAAN